MPKLRERVVFFKNFCWIICGQHIIIFCDYAIDYRAEFCSWEMWPIYINGCFKKINLSCGPVICVTSVKRQDLLLWVPFGNLKWLILVSKRGRVSVILSIGGEGGFTIYVYGHVSPLPNTPPAYDLCYVTVLPNTTSWVFREPPLGKKQGGVCGEEKKKGGTYVFQKKMSKNNIFFGGKKKMFQRIL